MAKSNVQLLQEALAKGDVEAAKKYAEKIEKSQAKTKKPKPSKIIIVEEEPKPKRGRKPKKTQDESQTRPQRGTRIPLKPDKDNQDSEEGDVLDVFDIRKGLYDDPSSWMAPVYRQDHAGTRIGADGKRMKEARKVSISVEQGRLKFWDPGTRSDGLNPKQRQIDKALAKQTATPRPGAKSAARQVARKHNVNCDFCGRPYQVYPSELLQAHDEKGIPYLYFKCDRCIKGR